MTDPGFGSFINSKLKTLPEGRKTGRTKKGGPIKIFNREIGAIPYLTVTQN